MTETKRDELEFLAIEDISRVLGRGFTPPKLTARPTMTIIDWLHSDVAIELELDWREQEIFCLLVRLEHGKLPEGYYVANGNPCRYHLQKVIRKHSWNTNPDAFAVISKRSDRLRHKDLAYMRHLLSAYEIVLTSCVERIRTVGRTVFENA